MPTITPDVIGKLGGFDETAFDNSGFDITTIATEVFSPQVGDAFQIIEPDFIDGTRIAGFDETAFDNSGFDTNTVTAVFEPTVDVTGAVAAAEQDTGAGSGT